MPKRSPNPKRRLTKQSELPRHLRVARVVGDRALGSFGVRPYDQSFVLSGRGGVLRVRGVRRQTPDYAKLAEAYLQLARRMQGLPPLADRDRVALEAFRERRARQRAERRQSRAQTRAREASVEERLEELRARHRAELDALLAELEDGGDPAGPSS